VLQNDATSPAGEILSGTLRCAACAARYPIRAGIADFLGTPQPPSLAQVTNEWPATAWVYERAWRPFALTLLSRKPFPYQRELPLMVRLAEPGRTGVFLDVACSNGLYARALARTMHTTSHVLGIDHSGPMLAEARRRALAAGLRITYIRASAQSLPVASAAIAGVTIGGSLNEIGNLDACLAEVRRTLTPGAPFVAMTLTRAETAPGRALQALLDSGGVVFWTPDELIADFARHGLHVEHREQHGLVLFTRAV
jgi:SAM-dependent methyltransferase